MSPIGRFLLRNCDNDLRINLKDETIRSYIHQSKWHYLQVRLIAIHLGITLEGGS